MWRLLLVMLAAGALAGCGGHAASPGAVVRGYEAAIFARDGGRLCAAFTPKLRKVLAERNAPATGGRFDCGRFLDEAIGYPHENMDRRFRGGALLSVGAPRTVRAGGESYVGVPATTRIDFEYSSYTMREGDRGTTTVHDLVWLARSGGRWRLVKPSATLLAATNADTVFAPGAVARLDAAPPDPDYTMDRAERTAWEAADYRRSFRTDVGHGPLACAGAATVVADPARDVYVYPAGSVMNPTGLPPRDDIRQVTVRRTRERICVAVEFASTPPDMTVSFTPRWPHAFAGDFDVQLVGGRVRAGTLTSGYLYFKGGERLLPDRVGSIAVYGHTVAFVVAPQEPGSSAGVPAAGAWSVAARSPAGYDTVTG